MPTYQVIKSGNIIEIYEYERLNLSAYNVNDDEDKPEEILDKEPNTQDNLRRSNHRARENIRRLALSNFENTANFITITFKDNVQDLDYANSEFKQFIQRLKRRKGKFDYLAVIEFQQRGAIHYHMLAGLDYESSGDRWHEYLTALWGHGGVNVKTLGGNDNIGAYLIKYLTKDHTIWVQPHLQNKRRYLSSRLPNKPTKLEGSDALYWVDTLTGQIPHFTSQYESFYTGKVMYREFNLERIKGQ
jgi:hypothetical protein